MSNETYIARLEESERVRAEMADSYAKALERIAQLETALKMVVMSGLLSTAKEIGRAALEGKESVG